MGRGAGTRSMRRRAKRSSCSRCAPRHTRQPQEQPSLRDALGGQEEGIIHIVRAAGLKQADMYDGSDPYVSALPEAAPHFEHARACSRARRRPQAIVYFNGLEIGRTQVFEDSCDPEFNAKFPVRVPLSDIHENTLRVELFDFGASAPSRR